MIENSINKISIETEIPKKEIIPCIEDWAIALMTQGVIVKLEIKRFRARISLEEEDVFNPDDSGIEWADFFRNYIFLGTKLIFPKKVNDKLLALEGMARKNLDNYSFDTVWGKFVPCTSFSDWKIRNDEIKESFYKTMENICKNLEMIKEDVFDEYKVYAKKMYETSRKTISYEDFEDKILKKIDKNFPNEKEFKESFEYNSIFFYIPIPSEIDFEVRKFEKLQKDREFIEKEIEMEDSIRREVMSKKKEYIDSFLKNTVVKMRQTTLDTINEIKKIINSDSEEISYSKCRKKLLSMIETVRELNLFNDEEVRDAIDQLQICVEKEKKFLSDEDIDRTLQELKEVIQNNIEKIRSYNDRSI